PPTRDRIESREPEDEEDASGDCERGRTAAAPRRVSAEIEQPLAIDPRRAGGGERERVGARDRMRRRDQPTAREMPPRVAVVHAMHLERDDEEECGQCGGASGSTAALPHRADSLDGHGGRCYSPPPMSFGRLLLIAVLPALVAARAGGEDATPAAAPPQETVVHGTPPRIVGRWLALSWIDRSEAGVATMPALWQIAEQDGKPVFTQVFAKMPEPIRSAVDQAGTQDQPWTPTPADLSALREQWDKLEPEESGFKSVW